MAQFKLSKFIDVGTKSYHTYTSWKVTLDAAGKRIIDQSIKDPVNLYHWTTPLPNGNGGYYADLDRIYLWVAVHTIETNSNWFYIGWANQNDQTFTVTENNNIIQTINSLVAGIH